MLPLKGCSSIKVMEVYVYVRAKVAAKRWCRYVVEVALSILFSLSLLLVFLAPNSYRMHSVSLLLSLISLSLSLLPALALFKTVPLSPPTQAASEQPSYGMHSASLLPLSSFSLFVSSTCCFFSCLRLFRFPFRPNTASEQASY
jgi:hypothetical protein